MPSKTTSRKPYLHRQLLQLRWKLLRNHRLTRILAFASILIIFLVFPRYPAVVPHDPARDALDLPADTYPDPHSLARFIREACGYLIRANYLGNMGKGSFIYRPELDEESGLMKEGEGYNTLRHAGALYALSSACVGVNAEYCEGAEQVIRRGGEWLVKYTVERVNRSEMYGVWSKSEIESPWRHKTKEVRLGGCGLGLVAMTEAFKVGGKIELKVLEGVGQFILKVLGKEDGGFWSYYRHGQVDKENEMMFFPGEGALGLIRLYRVTKDESYLKGAIGGLLWLARRGGEVVCDHWYLVATGELWGESWSEGREDIKRHGLRVRKACFERDVGRLDGSMVKSASFGTGVEAMMGGMVLGLDKETYCLAGRTIGMLLAVQYGGKREMLRGAVPGRAHVGVGEGRQVERTDGKFQVDTTQHSLSAVLGWVRVGGWEKMVCGRGGQPWVVRDDWASGARD